MRRAVIAFRVGAWILAVSVALTAPVYLFERPDVDFLRVHPVDAEATVISAYIDGMGGAPMVDYRFDVHGRTYTGSGTGGELGNGDVLRLPAGAKVRIQYAAADPSLSCTCYARSAADSQMPARQDGGFNPVGGLLILPLLGMTIFEITNGIGRRRLRGALAP
jgi:hypothetical protein